MVVTGIVYKLSNENGSYIGSTTNWYFRRAAHKSEKQNSQTSFRLLFENGVTEFNTEFLATIELMDKSKPELVKLKKLEQYHIDQCENAVNIRKAYMSPEDTRKKNRKRQRDRYHSDLEHRERVKKRCLNYYHKKARRARKRNRIELAKVGFRRPCMA